jgi:hypothetical protein
MGTPRSGLDNGKVINITQQFVRRMNKQSGCAAYSLANAIGSRRLRISCLKDECGISV